MVLWWGRMEGPLAVPGAYRARLIAGADSFEVSVEVRKDPRIQADRAGLREQFDFLLDLRDRISEVHRSIDALRDVRGQVQDLCRRLEERDEAPRIQEAARALADSLTAVEEALYQTRNRAPQDPLNYPIRLNNKLASLAAMAAVGDVRPTDQMHGVFVALDERVQGQLERLDRLFAEDLAAFNALVEESEVPAVLRPLRSPAPGAPRLR